MKQFFLPNNLQFYKKGDSGTGAIKGVLQTFSEYRFARYLWAICYDLQFP